MQCPSPPTSLVWSGDGAVYIVCSDGNGALWKDLIDHKRTASSSALFQERPCCADALEPSELAAYERSKETVASLFVDDEAEEQAPPELQIKDRDDDSDMAGTTQPWARSITRARLYRRRPRRRSAPHSPQRAAPLLADDRATRGAHRLLRSLPHAGRSRAKGCTRTPSTRTSLRLACMPPGISHHAPLSS